MGNDGHPVDLHHRNQKPEGSLDKMTRTDHKLRDNFKKNHTNTGQEPSQIDRKAWRKEQNNLIKNKITEHFEVLFMSKILFVGRSFEVDDLSITKVVRSMKTRVNLACQIVNLQDRAQIEFKIIE
ncbi:TPA: HNH/ENDO VII family nuclease [Photobacterium damselae]